MSETEAVHPASTGPLLLLGDSLTEAGPWEEAFPDRQVINAGRTGDTTADIGARIHEVVRKALG